MQFLDCKITLSFSNQKIKDRSETLINKGIYEVELKFIASLISYNVFDETPWYKNQPDGMVYADLFAYKYKGAVPDKLVEHGKLPASRLSSRMALIRRSDIEKMFEANPYNRVLPCTILSAPVWSSMLC